MLDDGGQEALGFDAALMRVLVEIVDPDVLRAFDIAAQAGHGQATLPASGGRLVQH